MDIENEKIITNEHKSFVIVGIVLAFLIIVGGTFAYLIFDVNISNKNIASATTCFDIIYDADNSSPITGTLIPSSSPAGGLSGKITIGMDEECDIDGYGNFYLNITTGSDILFQTVTPHCEDSQTLKTLGAYTDQASCEAQSNGKWVTEGTALKYAIYTTDDVTTSTIPVSVGYLDSVGQKTIYENFPITNTIVDYYVYVWLDGNLSDNSYANQSIVGDVSASVSQVPGDNFVEEETVYVDNILNGADPVLEPGMIPVTISDTGAVTSADTSQVWYSYTNKQWANAVLVNSTVRGTYINEDGTINGNLSIAEEDILAYYVWIPRYKYTFPNADGNPEPISIVFENASTPKSIPVSGSASGTDYYTHPAFTFGTNNELNGIWVGKFETAHTTLSSNTTNNNLGCTTTDCENANGLIIKPNVTSLRYNNISNQFYASRSMTRNSNPFGLTTSTDTHMMKNSEWGAVAYLSHSQYGINAEVGINSNSSYTTGAGNGTTYGTPGTGENTYPQSTTGNISGVFDISGGSFEYVMGNYNNTISSAGLSTLPESKYYNKYTVTSFTSCTLNKCGGHAFHETKGWYSDYADLDYYGGPWFGRGGFFLNGSSAGAFQMDDRSGGAEYYIGFRSVAIKGA